MGSVQSSGFQRLRPSSVRDRRIPDSLVSESQPLLQNQNQFMEAEHEVKAYGEKNLALEKEIGGLKPSFSSLGTMLQTNTPKSGSTPEAKATEGRRKEDITRLEQKVDKLKKSLDGIILGREAEKRINSAEISKQGRAITNMKEKNMNLEKKMAELETKLNEMTSTMIDIAAAIAETKDKSEKPETHNESEINNESFKPEEAPELNQASIVPAITISISENDFYGCFMILFFLVTLLIGMNL